MDQALKDFLDDRMATACDPALAMYQRRAGLFLDMGGHMKTDAAVKNGLNLKNKRVVLVLPGGWRLPYAGRDGSLGLKDINFSRGSIEWRGSKVFATLPVRSSCPAGSPSVVRHLACGP